MKYYKIRILLLILLYSCNKELTIKKGYLLSNSLKINGFYKELNESGKYTYRIYFFYMNGVVYTADVADSLGLIDLKNKLKNGLYNPPKE